MITKCRQIRENGETNKFSMKNRWKSKCKMKKKMKKNTEKKNEISTKKIVDFSKEFVSILEKYFPIFSIFF